MGTMVKIVPMDVPVDVAMIAVTIKANTQMVAAADVEGVADPDKAFSDMPSRHHLAEDADYQQDQREDIAKFVSHTADGCVPKGYNIF